MRQFFLSFGLALCLTVPVAQAQTPTWQWGTKTTNPSTTDDSQARRRSVATDASGNVYVGGEVRSANSTGTPGVRQFGTTSLSTAGYGFSTGFAAKLNAAGQWQWATPAQSLAPNATNGQFVFIDNVVVTPGGDSFVAGSAVGTSLRFGTLTQAIPGGEAHFVARLNGSGQCQWITFYGDDNTSAERMGLNPTNGELVVAGEYEGGALTLGSTTLPAPAAGAMAGFVARLSATGQWTSAVGVRTAGSGNVGMYYPAVGPQGQVAVIVYVENGTITLGSNTVSTTAGTPDKVVLAQLSPANQWQWVATSSSLAGVTARDFQYDGSGNLWTTGDGEPGERFGTLTLPANSLGFVGRVSATGQWNLLGAITGSTGSRLSAECLAVDARGNAVVTGELDAVQGMTYTYSFGPRNLSPGSTGVRSDYVARFSNAGQWDYAQLAPLNSSFFDITMDAAGSLLAIGDLYNAPITFGNNTLTGTSNGRDLFVAKLVNAGALTVRQAAGAAALDLYPNPTAAGTGATLRLAAPAPTALPLTLRDALGRAVRTATLPAGQREAAIGTTGLAPGLYLLEAGSSRAQLVVK